MQIKFFSLALVLGSSLFGQTPWLTTSDPVGIARSGATVIFGKNLESASWNPALLTTLDAPRSVFFSYNLEMQYTSQTLESNQIIHGSSDRNRSIPMLGLAWRLSPSLVLGLHSESTFQRHVDFAPLSPARFFGDRLLLSARRTEIQLAWSPEQYPQFSLGFGAGISKVDYQGGLSVRLNIPTNSSVALSTSNPSLGLVEQRIIQQGNASRSSFQFGGRWAINSQWSTGLAYQSGLSGNLSLTANRRDGIVGYYSTTGFGVPLVGATASAASLLSASTVRPSSGGYEFPGRLAWGFRYRANSTFTIELDLRKTVGSFMIPAWPTIATPTSAVAGAPSSLPFGGPASGLRIASSTSGFSLGTDINVNRNWIVRFGLGQDDAGISDDFVNPVLGGSRSATFSFGLGYQVWGGELNFGYQVRQSRDSSTTYLDGNWNVSGFSPTLTPLGIEGMGHIIALGFKKSF